MMGCRCKLLAAGLCAVGICLVQSGSAFVQYQDFRSGRGRFRGAEITVDRRGVPDWPLDPEFPGDVFTFARIMYNQYGGYRGGKWRTDWPDSDLNFSYRLQQLTSLQVNPLPVVLELSDPRLFDYPWIYIIEPGDGINMTDEEAQILRAYLDNGGFLMVDDFWGEYEWQAFYQDLKRVFPDREPVDLPPEHEIFHCVYDLAEPPQVPSIGHALRGMTYERPDAQEVHYRAVFDDKGRPQVIICHNTDLGDGWEREGENVFYFKEYSEPKAYPMGINILFYAMSH